MRRHMVRFAQEMSERETQIESRVSEVNDFMVEQDQPVLVHENVFRAEIPVNQREASGQCFRDQSRQETRRLKIARGAEAIVRLQAQRLEKSPVGEKRSEFVLMLPRAAVDRAKQLAEVDDVSALESAGQQPGFPVFMRLRHGLHGKQMVLAIFEYERRDRSGWSETIQPDQTESLPMNAARVREPVFGDAEFGERLLDDPGLTVGSFDQNRAVGYAPFERSEHGGLGRLDTSGFPQGTQQRAGLLDVQTVDHASI